MMIRLKWASVLRWLLAAFFAFGGVGNIFATDSILADYQRWGFPGWFHFVTGMLELTASVLLMTRYRFEGAILGSAVMAAAAATVIFHGEYAHAVPPFVTLVLSGLVAALVESGPSLLPEDRTGAE